jgi:hypothetical protein
VLGASSDARAASSDATLNKSWCFWVLLLICLVVVWLGLAISSAFAQGGTAVPTGGTAVIVTPTSAFSLAASPESTSPAPVSTTGPVGINGSPVVVVGWGAGAQGTYLAILAAIVVLGSFQCVLLLWLLIRR